MNVDDFVTNISRDMINALDDYKNEIKEKLTTSDNKIIVKIRGNCLVSIDENRSEYSMSLLSYKEYKDNNELRNEIKFLINDMICLLDQTLQKNSYWLLLRNGKKIIGICCFVFQQYYFGIQSIFVTPENTLKGFGGCFLTLLQDFGIIFNDVNKSILPILLMRTKENTNIKLIDFYIKYFFIKPTNEEDILLIKKIQKKSTAVDIEYYMILRLPLSYMFESIIIHKLPTDWESILAIAKIVNMPSYVVLENDKKYTKVEKVSNVLFHGNDNYNNWFEKDVKKWICGFFIKKNNCDNEANIEICEKFFKLKGVCANTITFNVTKNNDGSENFESLLLSLICKNDSDIQRLHNFMSFVCLLISKIMSTNNVFFMQEYDQHYKKYFLNKIKTLKITFGEQPIQIIFKKMSISFLKYDNWIGYDEYCFIANCFNYDIISLKPILEINNLNGPLTYREKQYYLWSIEKKIYEGSYKNNRKAVIVVNADEQQYVLSYYNHNLKLNSIDRAQETYNNYIQFLFMLKSKLQPILQPVVNIMTRNNSFCIEPQTTQFNEESMKFDNSVINNADDEIDSFSIQLENAIEKTTESIELGKYVYNKSGLGFMLPLPYFIGHLLEDGVEWPISMINSFLNLIIISPERNNEDYFFVINMASLSYIKPMSIHEISSVNNIYVVCNQDNHYHLYEYIVTNKTINVYDCTDSTDDSCDYKYNAMSILRRLLDIKKILKVSSTREEAISGNYWFIEFINPYTVYKNDCACCVLMEILLCKSFFGLSERIVEEKRRQYFVNKYLRLFTELKVHDLNVNDPIQDNVTTTDIIVQLKKYANIMSANLTDSKKLKKVLKKYMKCHVCKKKVVPHHLKNSFEMDSTKTPVSISIDEIICQDFTVHELHCNCFKFFHGRCYQEQILGTICSDCGVCYRADYCYICGDLKYIKTQQEPSEKEHDHLNVLSHTTATNELENVQTCKKRRKEKH